MEPTPANGPMTEPDVMLTMLDAAAIASVRPPMPEIEEGEGHEEEAEEQAARSEAQPEPDHRRRIEARAYELYLERGGKDGDHLSDWLQAERELKNTRG
jgi:hypothetical protein